MGWPPRADELGLKNGGSFMATKESVKQIVKNMKAEGKNLNFVLYYLQGKFQPKEIHEILKNAGY